MKRAIIVVFTFIICLSLCACGKSKAAANVDQLISEIGEVTLGQESVIVMAENAFAALKDNEKKQVEFEEVLLDARARYEELFKDEEARKITDAISAIGTVTKDSEVAIVAARNLFDLKDEEIQSRVSNYPELKAAEEALDDLKATEVTALIEDIGTVTLTSEEKIVTARDAYSALPLSVKNRVENMGVLEAAEQTLKSLKEEAKEKERKDTLAKLTSTTDKVEGITWYKSKSQPKYVNTRSYVLPYIGKSDSKTWLRVRCNYTDDNWVFFENIIFVVDGVRYTKSFSYFEINRDNGYGDVCEVADFSPTESDIEMLKAIADSSETIVRFEGDSKHYDLKIKSTDKQAIKDVLNAYEILQ